MTRSTRNILLAAVYAVAAAACGAGGPGENVPGGVMFPGPGSNPGAQPGEGIWRGRLTWTASQETSDVIGLVIGWGGWGDGHMTLLTDRGHFSGDIARHVVSSELAEFDVAALGITLAGFTWPNGNTVDDFRFDGAIAPPTEIEFDFSGAGDTGSGSLSFDPASDRGMDPAKLEGMWVVRNESENISATFEIRSAQIEGTDEDGCVYSGTVGFDTWTYSVYLYDVLLTVSNCPFSFGPDPNGEYLGPAGLTDLEPGSGANDLFIIGVKNRRAGRAITLALERI